MRPDVGFAAGRNVPRYLSVGELHGARAMLDDRPALRNRVVRCCGWDSRRDDRSRSPGIARPNESSGGLGRPEATIEGKATVALVPSSADDPLVLGASLPSDLRPSPSTRQSSARFPHSAERALEAGRVRGIIPYPAGDLAGGDANQRDYLRVLEDDARVARAWCATGASSRSASRATPCRCWRRADPGRTEPPPP